MSFCLTTDIRDELIKKIVVATDCTEADAIILDMALALGVTADQIATPLPYTVKALAIALSCVIAARNKSIMNVRGEDGADAYELKRQVWQKEVDRLKAGLTADVLTGGATNPTCGFPFSFTVERN